MGKRWIYLTHRWLGMTLCLFMALWFLSGVVMMYVGYPKLTQLERLARLPDLALGDDCCVSPQQALLAARKALTEEPRTNVPTPRVRDRGMPPDLRLTMLGNTPYWLASDDPDRPVSVNAITGEAVQRFDEEHALRVASAFAPKSRPRLMGEIRQDIFTVSRGLNVHRPLFRIALDDVDGTEIYVSSRTGEVVRDSTRLERGWNYLGAILHFFYPLKGEFFDKLRSDIIIYTSLAGTFLALLGIWIGVLRWRINGRFGNGSRSPYRENWMHWHHISGLIFGLVTLTWILSGMLSLNPWRVFDSNGPQLDRGAFAGIGMEQARFPLPLHTATARAGFPVREIGIRLFNGQPYYLLRAGDGRTRLIVADDPGNENQVMERIPDAALLSAATKLLADHRIVRATVLVSHDNYYYDRQPHNMSGHIERRLPALRVEFDDPMRTWIHLDPHTASVFNRLDDVGRIRRWLFNFLHSFDLRGFVDSRPLWDITLILLSLGGFAICISGVVIGWRRLKRSATLPATR